MPRPRMAVLYFLALATSVGVSAAEFKPGEVIVKYRAGVLRTRSNMNVLYDSVGAKSIQHYTGSMSGFEQLFLNDNVTVEDAIVELRKSKVVEYAQPNYILHALPSDDSVIAYDDEPGEERGVPCLFP